MHLLDILQLDTSQAGFHENLQARLQGQPEHAAALQASVREIIERVRVYNDDALLHYSKTFDRLVVSQVADLEVSKNLWSDAFNALGDDERQALVQASERVQDYHRRQIQASWEYTDEFGNLLGQKITPIERAGIYVPGGKAAYPSSVLMNAIPAKVAGVPEVIMVVPAPAGELNPLVLAAAWLVGVDRLFKLGGAHSVAALAYGTETIPAVSKIVGPGNAYVAEAKRQVFGKVGIDMVAGPSEILVIADATANPDWVAMDLFSQAEHDEAAQAILISPDAKLLSQVQLSAQKALSAQPRSKIIAQSMNNRGIFIKTESLAEAIELSNQIAPEHLEVYVDQAEQWLPKIKHAGAIFLGAYTPEAFGDYCAGPNHVLPTSGSARFASALGVYDFQKRSSIIQCSKSGAVSLAKIAHTLATGEGLAAHAQSAYLRGAEEEIL